MNSISEIMQRMTDPSYLATKTMTELYDASYECRPALIDKLLYPGTYLFAGAPKVGKSFFMMQLAYHISTGKPLWGYPVQKGTVLYLSLEDTEARLQHRLYQMFGVECSDDLHFAVSANQLDGGLKEQLSGFIAHYSDTKLIIIDTLQKIRENFVDKLSYASDYDVISQLKSFADTYKICLILVHHTRKQQAEDKFDMISGTNGLLGAADGAFILQKEKRSAQSAALEISGRDQQDRRLLLKRDTETLCWMLEREETEVWERPNEPLLELIAAKINENCPKWTGTASELAEFIGAEISANVLTRKLNPNADRLIDEYHILYKNQHTRDSRIITLEYRSWYIKYRHNRHNRHTSIERTKEMTKNTLFMNVTEVIEELGVSKPYAYKVIRKLNEELAAQGYLTISGKVNRKFFLEKCYGESEGLRKEI